MGQVIDLPVDTALNPATGEQNGERRGLRPREIARQLGLAPAVVYEAFHNGEFERVWRFGRAIVVPADEVERWLASKSA